MAQTVKPGLTGAQRMVYGMGHAISKYSLGSQRQPEAIKLDIVCVLADYLGVVVKGFDEDTFMKACGYSDRVRTK